LGKLAFGGSAKREEAGEREKGQLGGCGYRKRGTKEEIGKISHYRADGPSNSLILVHKGVHHCSKKTTGGKGATEWTHMYPGI